MFLCASWEMLGSPLKLKFCGFKQSLAAENEFFLTEPSMGSREITSPLESTHYQTESVVESNSVHLVKYCMFF